VPGGVELPDDLFAAVVEQLTAREDRDPAAPLFAGVAADRLRMAILRGCRDGGVPHFSPHALRHRRISLLHRQGVSWAEIGARVGRRSKVVTADRYSHALVDYREINRAELLKRVRTVHTTPRAAKAVTCSRVLGQYRPLHARLVANLRTLKAACGSAGFRRSFQSRTSPFWGVRGTEQVPDSDNGVLDVGRRPLEIGEQIVCEVRQRGSVEVLGLISVPPSLRTRPVERGSQNTDSPLGVCGYPVLSLLGQLHLLPQL
jgi:hypothetical protein